MKKQIIYGSITFLLSFIIMVLLFFPYNNITVIGISRLQNQTKTKISYSSINSGAFSTQIDNLEINDVPIGKIHAGYSPLSLLMKRVTLEASGSINGKANLSAKQSKFDIDINPAIINLFAKDAEFSGQVKISGTASPDNATAALVGYAEKTAIVTPIGKLDFEKLDAEIDVKGNLVTIKKLTSKDDMALNLSGTININKRDFEKSMVNISGTVNVIGSEKKLTLKGRMNNLQPSLY